MKIEGPAALAVHAPWRSRPSAKRGEWEKKLSELIEEASKRSFEYGKFDCALFACDAIKSLTGFDPREIIAEQYQGEEEAEKIILQYGGIEGIAAAVADRFGFNLIPVSFAQRGDIVLAKIKNIKSLGVCIGKKVVFPCGRPQKGLVFIDIDSKLLIKAWRI
jgi:hypothetical protein